MYIGDQRVWLRSKYRARFNRLVVLIEPAVPQAGESERRIVCHSKVVWLLLFGAKSLPFIERALALPMAKPSVVHACPAGDGEKSSAIIGDFLHAEG